VKRLSAATTSVVFLLCALLLLPQSATAQSATAQSGAAQSVPALPEPAAANPIVPPLVNFSGVLTDLDGKPITGVVGVTFLLYKDSQGGPPLWLETQNVRPDKTGHYTAMLGSASSQGLPAGIFAAGEAHWLGVQVSGQAEQPRVLLVSAPYALKAGDAETVGGLPPSAFVLATHSNGPPTANGPRIGTTQPNQKKSASPATTSDVTTTGGTANYLPLFNGASTVVDSAFYQSGSGSSAKIGIGTTSPASTLDVKGGATIRGTLSLPTTGTATAAAGKNSQPVSLQASAFNSTISTPVNETFEWQAEAAGNNTGSPSGSLNLLFGQGATLPSETGLHLSGNGSITATSFTGNGSGLTNVTAANSKELGGVASSSYARLGVSNPSTKSGTTFNADDAGATLWVYQNGTGNGKPKSANGIQAFTSSPTGYGVIGAVQASSGTSAGVLGTTSSNFGVGVAGESGSSNGVSVTGMNNGSGVGVWGDTAAPSNQAFAGVQGTADANYAGVFLNNASGVISPTIFLSNATTDTSAFVFESTTIYGTCTINVSGDLHCSGNVSSVVPADGGARKVAVYSMQSPENWFEDAGSGQLTNGSARIAFDRTFAQTVNAGVEYHVFLTPKGDSEGLYVSNETAQGFEVHEQRGGRSNIAFDYRIMARRAGYEKVRLEDFTEQFKKREAAGKGMWRGAHPPAAAQPGSTPPVKALTAGAN
jgi:hypothetical protein